MYTPESKNNKSYDTWLRGGCLDGLITLVTLGYLGLETREVYNFHARIGQKSVSYERRIVRNNKPRV